VLLNLMIAELLARIEADENRAGLVLTEKNDWRSASARCWNLGQLPCLHRAGAV
jgi:hypothetical protein